MQEQPSSARDAVFKRVMPGTTLILTDAQDINDLGEITGQATDPSTGATVAFEAIPVE